MRHKPNITLMMGALASMGASITEELQKAIDEGKVQPRHPLPKPSEFMAKYQPVCKDVYFPYQSLKERHAPKGMQSPRKGKKR